MTLATGYHHPGPVEAPRPVQLSEHVFLVAGEHLSHPFDASAYLIAGPKPALIDCGSAFGWPATRANAIAAGVDPADVQVVLASHCHFDHVSAFAQLALESDALLLMHESDAPGAATGDQDLTAAFLYGTEAPPVAVAGTLPDEYHSGPVHVKVIHTPGHTPGSSCFVVEDGPMRLLLTADTLFGGYHPRIGSDIDAWSESLGLLAEADFDYLSVGHAHPPLIPHGHQVLAEARLQLGVYFHPWFRPFHMDFST